MDRVTGVGVTPEVVNSGLISFVIGNGGAKMLLVKGYTDALAEVSVMFQFQASIAVVVTGGMVRVVV